MNEIKHSKPLTYRIYDYLKENHVGKENAISGADLADKFNISQRKLREVVNEIRNSQELEKIIASSNNGYFICTNEEFRRANNRLLSTAFNLLRTARANEHKAGLDGQMKMQLGEFYKDTFQAFGSK
jgi:transcriptional antiterminator